MVQEKNYIPWKTILGKEYFIPGETCDTVGHKWFYEEDDEPQSDEELIGLYLAVRGPGANLLLNAPPDPRGRMSQRWRYALMRLRKNIDLLGMN